MGQTQNRRQTQNFGEGASHYTTQTGSSSRTLPCIDSSGIGPFFSRSSCRRHKAGSIISPRLFVCAGTYRLLRIQSSFLWPWSDRFRTRWTTNRHESPRKSKERKEKIDVERNEGRLRQTQNKNQYQSALFILCLLIVPPSACLIAYEDEPVG